MKKLLVLLALCMVLSVMMVACQEATDDPAESTDAQTTTAEGTTAADETTEPEATEPETTEPETTQPETTKPENNEPVKVVAGISFDAMANVYNGEIDMDNLYFSSGTEYFEWAKVATINHLVDSLKVLGWVAFYTETEGVLGYSVDGTAPVYPEGFSTPAEQDVLDHVAANLPGGKSAARMFSDIPVRALSAGEHVIALFAKDADGNEEMFAEFKLVKVLPYVENAHARFSIDNITLNNVPYVTEGKVQAELAALNNTVTVAADVEKGTLSFRGWASFEAAPAAEFGYYIGEDIAIITDAAYIQDRPDLVQAGVANGAGYNITVSIADLAVGTYPVGVIAKLQDGTYAQLFSFYLTIEPVEPLDIDFTQAPISGSYPNLWPGNGLATTPALNATDYMIILHYGSINLGEVDLGKYSKVTVTYGNMVGDYVDVAGNVGNYDNEFNATQKRVMLTNTVAATQDGTAFEFTPAEEAIIAYANYEQSEASLVLRTVEIDLTEVEYNGQTYLTFDFRNAEGAFGYIANLIVVTDIVFS